MAQSTEIWDVAVIGAGPAGAMAALAAASLGKRVVILERFGIPRYKTCSSYRQIVYVLAARLAGKDQDFRRPAC
jgi:flavin-dependent dehydrogenase